jgi:glycosyltransferase involved in cell wall biosynthesis
MKTTLPKLIKDPTDTKKIMKDTMNENKITHAPQNNFDLYCDLSKIINKIQVDFGGGSPISKTILMASLFLNYHLKNYVEIGVYRGRSFFPMAYIAEQNACMAYGIDPYNFDDAKENDLEEQKKEEVNTFLSRIDFSAMYDDVTSFQIENNLDKASKIIRETSEEAHPFFKNNQIEIDMLHIDGNHDTEFVRKDAELYIPLVKNGGFIIFDDINWISIKPVYNEWKNKYEVIFTNGEYAILYKSIAGEKFSEVDKFDLNILNGFAENLTQSLASQKNPKENITITVVVTTYNHEDYLSKCFDSILAQRGQFDLEIIIGDDFSTDRTPLIIDQYMEIFKAFQVKAIRIPTDENIGIVKNFERCLGFCTGKYFAVCEGDDYWINNSKIQRCLDFMNVHPECSFCFSEFYLLEQTTGIISRLSDQVNSPEVFSTHSLVYNNLIGNFSCCFYDSQYLSEIPRDVFETFTVDWMFNLVYSQFGEIGHLSQILSVYRKHTKGAWTGQRQDEQAIKLYSLINDYNRILDFTYDAEFTQYQEYLRTTFPVLSDYTAVDLIIYDDTFPHPLSIFRVVEFAFYLEKIDHILILSSGLSLKALEDIQLDSLLKKWKKVQLKYAHKVQVFQNGIKVKGKVIYTVFLNNAYFLIDEIEKLKIPLIFTLYPGGGFGLENAESDKKLQRVTSSPCFKKVIVTQKITYDYLVNNGFCTEDQIVFIYGVVTSLEKINNPIGETRHYGSDKDTLDICFGAFKYTPQGIDKGYDVFIKTAKILSKKYSNIQFHVFGGFTKEDISVTELGDRIKFYGPHDSAWLDKFFEDKDIILSPNRPGMIYEGSFDGFPTGTCTEAALRETAIFCTDDLNQNLHFINNEEIVLISHEPDEIASTVEFYLEHPEELTKIGKNGRQKVKDLYGYEKQIKPRVTLLTNAIQNHEVLSQQIEAEFNKRNSRKTDIKNSKHLIQLAKKIKNRINLLLDVKLIKSSPLFNEKWYLAHNADVAKARIDPAMHYLQFGAFENRDPSQYFSSQYYFDNYPDVFHARVNPLVHFLRYGCKEGRNIEKTNR